MTFTVPVTDPAVISSAASNTNPIRNTARAHQLAARVELFVREQVVPYERDPRCGAHGPAEELIVDLRDRARAAGLLTPHILPDGSHLTHRETALVLRAAGLSLLGPIALNVAAAGYGGVIDDQGGGLGSALPHC